MERLDADPRGFNALETGNVFRRDRDLEVPVATVEWVGQLPVELSSFIGREDAVAECCALVGHGRLLTLTGPGGIGKSRLAWHVARCSAAAFRDGTFLAELGSVKDSALVPRVVASALGLAERAGEELTDMLVVALRARQLLLIMDDCDPQVEACAALAIRLLHDIPGLGVLATTRERLDVRGEVVWRVSSLTTASPAASFDDISSNEAVRLFVERAHEVAPWFRLDAGNAARVAQLCRRLDGIPLAIELAAARMRALDLDELLTRLEGKFELTMRGSRTAPTRQQTLRATIDWSYYLLNEVERALFRRLSVFSCGFAVDAAELVTAGDPLGTGDVLPLLERLIDKSLVVSGTRGGFVRQWLLEPLREYARERLLESGEEEEVRQRHFDWILSCAESIDPEYLTPEAVAARMLERDNLRSALAWTADTSKGLPALRLAVAAAPIWNYEGHFAEGIRWLTRALDLPGATEIRSIRGFAFKWISILSFGLGNMPAARDAIRQAQDLLADGQPEMPPCCAAVLGNIERASGNLDAALRLYREGLHFYQMRGLHFPEQVILFMMSSVLFELGNYAESRQACERCLALGGELAFATGRAQVILAYLANHEGKQVEAERLAEKALARFREHADPTAIGMALRALARFKLEQCRFSLTWVWLAEALDIALTQGDRMSLARTLETVACVLANDAPREAAQIAGAASTLRTRTGTVPWPSEQATLDRWLGMAQSKLGSRAYTECWQFGTDLSDAEAASAARRFVAKVQSSHESSKPASVSATQLTARQKQVAALVADGLTNQQIGDQLIISPATARAHVEQILGRLELHGRAQLAAWAVTHGLAPHVGPDSGGGDR